MKKYKKQLLALTLLGFFTPLIAACSTVEGVGEDIQKAGEWIEEKAK